jgi:hypothetical protein
MTVAALVSGCSMSLQKRPDQHAQTCTTTRGYWIADYAISGAALATAAAGTVWSVADGTNDASRTMIGVGVLSGLIYYASADNGRMWSRECGAIEPMPVAVR